MVKLAKCLDIQSVLGWKDSLKLTKNYKPVDIWNMDEAGCFFKALFSSFLAEERAKQEEVKNLKPD